MESTALGDFFEIANEFLAFGIDEQAGLAGIVAQAAIDAIDPIADKRIGGGGVIFGHKRADPLLKELFNNGPVRLCSASAALIAAGVAIEFHGERTLPYGHPGVMDHGALKKKLTGGLGMGFGFNDNFFEHMDGVFDFLHQEHAHRVDVEIERPDEGPHNVEVERFDVIRFRSS